MAKSFLSHYDPDDYKSDQYGYNDYAITTGFSMVVNELLQNAGYSEDNKAIITGVGGSGQVLGTSCQTLNENNVCRYLPLHYFKYKDYKNIFIVDDYIYSGATINKIIRSLWHSNRDNIKGIICIDMCSYFNEDIVRPTNNLRYARWHIRGG